MPKPAVVVCQLARCHAGPGCPICEDVPCECARCREAKAPAELPGDRGNLDEIAPELLGELYDAEQAEAKGKP